MKQTTLPFTNKKRPTLLAAALTFLALLTACTTEESMESMKRKAESGDAQAQFDLAMIYYEGEGAPSDDIEAVKRFLGLNYALAGGKRGEELCEGGKVVFEKRPNKAMPKRNTTLARCMLMAMAYREMILKP